jgi:hypothetical protein
LRFTIGDLSGDSAAAAHKDDAVDVGDTKLRDRGIVEVSSDISSDISSGIRSLDTYTPREYDMLRLEADIQAINSRLDTVNRTLARLSQVDLEHYSYMQRSRSVGMLTLVLITVAILGGLNNAKYREQWGEAAITIALAAAGYYANAPRVNPSSIHQVAGVAGSKKGSGGGGSEGLP